MNGRVTSHFMLRSWLANETWSSNLIGRLSCNFVPKSKASCTQRLHGPVFYWVSDLHTFFWLHTLENFQQLVRFLLLCCDAQSEVPCSDVYEQDTTNNWVWLAVVLLVTIYGIASNSYYWSDQPMEFQESVGAGQNLIFVSMVSHSVVYTWSCSFLLLLSFSNHVTY